MQVSVEISLYSLQDDYKIRVEEFLENLSKEFGMKTYYTPMSTTIIGEYNTIMEILEEHIKPVFEKSSAVFVLKISNACVDEFPEIEDN